MDGNYEIFPFPSCLQSRDHGLVWKVCLHIKLQEHHQAKTSTVLGNLLDPARETSWTDSSATLVLYPLIRQKWIMKATMRTGNLKQNDSKAI